VKDPKRINTNFAAGRALWVFSRLILCVMGVCIIAIPVLNDFQYAVQARNQIIAGAAQNARLSKANCDAQLKKYGAMAKDWNINQQAFRWQEEDTKDCLTGQYVHERTLTAAKESPKPTLRASIIANRYIVLIGLALFAAGLS
jgi:hypothetical protein